MSSDARYPGLPTATPLTRERWQTLEPLIDAAIDLGPDQRRAFLAEACGSDSALLAQLEQLLAEYDRRDVLLDRPAAERFAAIFDAGIGSLPTVLAEKYRLDREIGRGGMATVYLAWDIRHERNVAVKVLHPHVAAALGMGRFIDEIRTTAQLHHPHLLGLHDSGEADGSLFYVMPYVEGGSLRRLLDHEGRLPVNDAIRIACEIAAALDAAHRRGVIHRDIKPENILLDNGAALLADFGIALALSDTRARVTRPGITLGTPQYMSPEQAAEGAIDIRSDVYVLGTVLYEMLVGETPFTGSSDVSIAAKRAAVPAPRLRDLRAEITEALESAVARALARDPADRYGSASEFADALRASSVHIATATTPAEAPSAEAGRATRGRWISIVLASLVVTLVAASWVRWGREIVPPVDLNKIVIVPFGVTGADSSDNTYAHGPAILLAPLLTGEGGPLAVDWRTAISAYDRARNESGNSSDLARDVARRVGAGQALFGHVLLASGRLTITANLVRTDRGEARPLTPVTGSPDSLTTLLDSLLRQILVRGAGIPEHTVAYVNSQSLPALRAYIDGRRAYYRARNNDAIQHFVRALDIDSTFALAALDLATATASLRQMHCWNNQCAAITSSPGFPEVGPRSNDALFDRASRLAWEARSRLGPRDLPLLNALREPNPKPRWASEVLVGLLSAADAASDRPETLYLLGRLTLYQGHAVGLSGAFGLAEMRLNRALLLDPSYLAPRALLVEVAAYEGNQEKLRRLGREYLARDPVSPTADFVRWRVAIGTSDNAALRAIRARFDSLDVATLEQIMIAGQMSGVGLDDADRAASLAVKRADSRDRNAALYWAGILALNRGRPHLSDSLLRLSRERDSTSEQVWRSSTLAALFGDGDMLSAERGARERAEYLAQDTAGKRGLTSIRSSEALHQALWALEQGRIGEAQAIVSWLRRQEDQRIVAVTEMLIATKTGSSDAGALRARVDSDSRTGCCRAPRWINLALAMAHKSAGADSAALAALRRGVWTHMTLFLSTHLRMEGEISARLGDRQRAIRAYEHYIALRSNPEPQLRAQRDSVLTELNRLRRLRQ